MRALLVLWGCVVFTAQPTFAAESKAPRSTVKSIDLSENQRARQLFRLGMNAYKAGRIEEARQLLGEAWELQKSYDIAAILGQIEVELGNVVRANELLDYSVQNFPPIESDEKLTTMRKMRELARRQITELDVYCESSGVELWLDGRVVGPLPLSMPLYVTPGHHTLRLRRGGESVGAIVSVEARPGQRLPVELSMVTLTSPASAPKEQPQLAPKPVASDQETAAPLWPVYVGGGLVALNVAAAIGFHVASQDAVERADSLKARLADASSTCGTSAASSEALICSQYSDATSERDQYSRLTTYTAVAATTFTVATVAYWFLAKPGTPRGKTPEKSSVSRPLGWAFSGDRTSAYLSARGSF